MLKSVLVQDVNVYEPVQMWPDVDCEMKLLFFSQKATRLGTSSVG